MAHDDVDNSFPPAIVIIVIPLGIAVVKTLALRPHGIDGSKVDDHEKIHTGMCQNGASDGVIQAGLVHVG
jgi:hypothetical protein